MKKVLITLMLVLGTTLVQAQDYKWLIEKTHPNSHTLKVIGYDETCKAIKVFLYKDKDIVDTFITTVDRGFAKYHTDPKRLDGITTIAIDCIK